MNNEIWKSVHIDPYSSYYEVSSLGRVRRIETGLILSQSTSRTGYKSVMLSAEGRQKRVEVHRLVAKVFLEHFSSGLVCDHIDGNPANNDHQNLRMVSRSFNQRASRKKNRGSISYFRGVGRHSNNRHWVINFNKRYCGISKSQAEAASIWNELAIKNNWPRECLNDTDTIEAVRLAELSSGATI